MLAAAELVEQAGVLPEGPRRRRGRPPAAAAGAVAVGKEGQGEDSRRGRNPTASKEASRAKEQVEEVVQEEEEEEEASEGEEEAWWDLEVRGDGGWRPGFEVWEHWIGVHSTGERTRVQLVLSGARGGQHWRPFQMRLGGYASWLRSVGPPGYSGPWVD